MLPTTYRLRRSRDFAAAVRRGRRAGRRTVVVHLHAVSGDTPPQIGFVVSRSVGPAVTRNRVRRRLRHIIRDHLGELSRGTVLVVRALPAAAGATYPSLRRDVAAALRSAGVREVRS